MTSPEFPYPCPWVWVAGDSGEEMIFTVNWDTATSEIMSAIAFRDINCTYDTIYLGDHEFPVDIGETLIRYSDFSTTEYHYITDIIMSPISVIGFPIAYNFIARATLGVT